MSRDQMSGDPLSRDQKGRPARRGRRIAVWLVSTISLLTAVGAFALILVATDLLNAGRTATGSTAPGPSSSPRLISMAPGDIQMPEGADCAGCHVVDGGVVGVRSIPVIAHPIHGWSTCTACHANDALVATAPGHTGIHAEQCLVCHRDSSKPAPTPKHPTLPDADCLACHGPLVPLPSSMTDRPKELCWLCHHN